MIIRNMPDDAMDYEFIVAIPNGGHYTFTGKYADGHEAEKAALEYGGIVIHNVRIQGHQESKPKEKYYIFSGSWYWGCWATNEEEARKQYDDIFLDDLSIDTDDVQIKVEED